MTRRRTVSVVVPILAWIGGACATGPKADKASTPSGDEAASPPQAEASSKPSEAAKPKVAEASHLRVNQVGYFPKWGKAATLVSNAAESVEWKLLAAAPHGSVIANGKSKVVGPDASSGDSVHVIDFSAFAIPGKGYELQVGNDKSFPFDIEDSIYAQLKVDALHFFYHHRSGVPIAMPYAGDEVWARGAGHEADAKVECLPELECGFTMDVHGGWYDAGDHGKYVVNAGISVWTLLNAYERNDNLGAETIAFADGSIAIPEAGNGVNDLLDEARFELEWMMRMQAPDTARPSGAGGGPPKWAGMVFHKVHEVAWSPVPHSPADAKVARFLHRPSTAATLNVAAVAAQGARIWKRIDPAFAKQCLKSAERAWKAATATPDMFAPDTDHTGGGPYNDNHLEDDFYWAAAELFLTTKKSVYAKAMKATTPSAQVSTTRPSPMTWDWTGALGVISIATVPGADRALVDDSRKAIVAAADVFVANVDREGYRTPLPLDAEKKYVWGSNSFVLNNAIILGLAYDFTKDGKYLQGAIDGMDYVLGRNAMSMSYVSGYGENPLVNPHHRFWAKQKDPAYPSLPPGVVSGGPNSSLQDPYAQQAGLPGCAPQKCYVDHIESWSTNEIAINWNAPLVWVTAFLDETAR